MCNKSANSLHMNDDVCTKYANILYLHTVCMFTSLMSVYAVFALGSNDHWLQRTFLGRGKSWAAILQSRIWAALG